MNVLEAIRTKRAVREFTDQPIPRDVLERILRAALKAQSSKNTQPWQLIVVEDRDTLVKLSKMGDFMGHVANSQACIAFVAPNDNAWTCFDLGQCAAYLQLAAHELGVGSCLGAVYHPAEAKKLLGIPAELSFNAVVSLGYAPSTFTPARMGGRKPLGEAVHWENW